MSHSSSVIQFIIDNLEYVEDFIRERPDIESVQQFLTAHPSYTEEFIQAGLWSCAVPNSYVEESH